MTKHALLAAIAVLLAFPTSAQTAAHDVTVTVPTVRVLSVGGDLTLTQTAVVAGDAQISYSGTSSYAVTTNASNDKITGYISDAAGAFPSGLSLSVSLASAGGSSASAGSQALGTSAVDLVTGIANLNASSKAISYAATAGLSVVAGDYTREITYTITAG